MAGGVPVSGIAKWNGAEWSAAGDFVATHVEILKPLDPQLNGTPELYAGGSIVLADGAITNGVARWSGEWWKKLGSGTGSIVYALSVYEDGYGGGPALIAAGSFDGIGEDGAPLTRIARWSGSAWTPLASGIGATVYALEVHQDPFGTALYAGGSFTTAGGNAAVGIARWDGRAWSAVNGGVSGGSKWVRALMNYDDGSGMSLFVAGSFTHAGGIEVNGVARFRNWQWSALSDASGVLGPQGTDAIVEFDDGTGPALYFGGSFRASALGDSYLTRWRACSRPGCVPAMPSDLNCDGVVDGDDLGTLLGQWGACPGCAADFNGNGVVDGDDLGTLLGQWG